MDLSKFMDRFRDAVADHRQAIEACLESLASDPPDAGQVRADLARRLHTLKGEARMMGFEGVAELAHAAEDHIKRSGEDGPLAEPDLLLEALDASANLVEAGPEARAEELVRRLRGRPAVKPADSSEAPGSTPEVSDRFLRRFRDGARERLQTVESALRRLREAPEDDERARDLMREVHTLKGEARMVGLAEVAGLVHAFEDRLKTIREGGWQELTSQRDLLEETVDLVGGLIDGSLVREELDLSSLRERLGASTDGSSSGPRVSPPSPGPPKAVVPGATGGGRAPETVRLSVEKLERLAGVTGDLLVRHSAAEVRLEDLRRVLERCKGLEKGLRNLEDDADGELGHWRGEATRLRASLQDLEKREKTALLEMNLSLTELRGRIQEVRMLPISTIFDFYPRIVREMAREMGKEIRLEVEGRETELDRRIMEEIRDPLVHLVRNALDHGIESRSEREMAGKPPKGRLRLAATHQGDRIAVVVEDDGRGMDPETIREAAVSKGILEEAEAAELDDQASLELIFRAGFSTRGEVTEISGRGVGMDVVARHVAALGGSVSIRSRPGEGCTVTLAVPLTLALVRVLLVRAAGQIWAFPSLEVEDVVRREIEEGEQGYRVVRRGDDLLVVRDLPQLLGRSQVETWGAPPTIVLSDEAGGAAIVVEELIGEREVVVKGLGPYLQNVPVISGATLLGDGSVALVLDPSRLLERSRARSETALGEVEVSRHPIRSSWGYGRVLVVDDSFVIRDMMRGLLEGAGFQVVLAVDGRDALRRLRAEQFDLVVSDVQMPNLDGLGLGRAIRADERLDELPFVLVTTLDGDADRKAGIDAGADAYLVKKELERGQFLATVRDLIAVPGSRRAG